MWAEFEPSVAPVSAASLDGVDAAADFQLVKGCQ